MFGKVSVIRFSHSAAAMLTVGAVAFSGCRILSPQSSTATPLPTPVIHSPKTDLPEQYSAFRPIMPGEFIPPLPTPTISISEPPNVEISKGEISIIEAKPDIEVLSKIEELNRKIAGLETQLEEARRVPPPIPSAPFDSLTPEREPPRAFKILPVINKSDVIVYRDESQDVRIEIPDKALFLPDAWQLTADGEETLRTIAAEIRAGDSKAFLDIEGHTDSLIDDPNNPMQKHEISSKKTKEILDFFVNSLRWDVARIRTSIFGSNRPVADNETPGGIARNNRIEIVVRDE